MTAGCIGVAALKLDTDVVAFDDHLVTGDTLRGRRG